MHGYLLSVLYSFINKDKNLQSLGRISYERKEFMQETKHTQQTATRTAQNQDMGLSLMYCFKKGA